MGGFVRKLLNHLGFFKGDGDLESRDGGVSAKLSINTRNSRPSNPTPVVSECIPGAGGVQVFKTDPYPFYSIFSLCLSIPG